jgi:hypothetical protein
MAVTLFKLEFTGRNLIYSIETLSNFVTDKKRVAAAWPVLTLWTEFIGNAAVDNRPWVGSVALEADRKGNSST